MVYNINKNNIILKNKIPKNKSKKVVYDFFE